MRISTSLHRSSVGFRRFVGSIQIPVLEWNHAGRLSLPVARLFQRRLTCYVLVSAPRCPPDGKAIAFQFYRIVVSCTCTRLARQSHSYYFGRNTWWPEASEFTIGWIQHYSQWSCKLDSLVSFLFFSEIFRLNIITDFSYISWSAPSVILASWSNSQVRKWRLEQTKHLPSKRSEYLMSSTGTVHIRKY